MANIRLPEFGIKKDELTLQSQDPNAVMYGVTPDSKFIPIKINDAGEIQIGGTINLEPGDIEIGAVEIKNHDTDDRVFVNTDHEMLVEARMHDGAGTDLTSTGGALDVNLKSGFVVDVDDNSIAPNQAGLHLGINLLYGYNGSTFHERIHSTSNRLLVDNTQQTQPISASALPLPTGASTSALQIDGNLSLSTIDSTLSTKLDVPLSTRATEATLIGLSAKIPVLGQALMIASQPVVIASDQTAIPILVASLPLPSGAATEATLLDIKTQTDKLTFNTTMLTVDGSGVTQPISAAALPLPAGASTEATLLALSAKIPSLGQALMVASQPVVIASDQSPIDVAITSGAGGPTDTDDGSILGGQLSVLNASLQYGWDGSNWTRLKSISERLEVSLFDGQHNKQTQYSAFGLLKTVSESMVADHRFIDATRTDAEWNTTFTGTGSRSFVGTGIKLNTGASTASKAQMDTVNSHMYQSGRGQMVKFSVILNDAGIAGNIREWGYGDDNDGYFFRLDGTTLQIIIKRSGSETVINSSNWDVPVTPDANGHIFYIQFEWLGVGDIYFYHDESLVHTHHFIGTSPEFSVDNPDLPLRLRNENTTNATDVSLRLGCVAIITEGGLVISGIDSTGQLHQASVTPDGRLEVNATIVPTETSPVTTMHEAVVKDDAFLVKLLSFNLGSAGVEGSIMLIRNSGGSGNTLYIHTLGTNNEVKSQTAKINIYKFPVVTVTGTPETIENQLVGSATASVMSVFSSPTISANGSLLYSFATGANQNDLRRNFFFGAALPPGFDYLITGIGSNNNTLVDLSFEWAEV